MVWKIFSNKKGKENEENEISNIVEVSKENMPDDEIKPAAEEKAEVKVKEKKEEKIYIMPLGGLGEVGKNMTLLQYRDEIVVIDAGLTFPSDDMPGVDLVIPDFSYLTKNIEKLKAIILTHGHEDHIGAVPYLLKDLPDGIPIYSSKLTIGLVKIKLEAREDTREYNFVEVKGRDRVKIGKYFDTEIINVTHSIPDSFAAAFHTPVGIIVHTGDFKVDLTPIKGESMDFYKLAELGEKGVLALLSDSTNAEREGFTFSEHSVREALKQAFDNSYGRIIVASFASHIHRIQQVIDLANEYGRKIAIDGRSMVRVTEISAKLGYLDVPEGMLIQLKEVENYDDKEILLLCTGSQGEPMSALSRIANKTHKHINVKNGDTVLISATPIPGNEKAVHGTINSLLKNGAEVIYEKIAGIHASGHGSQDELKLMLNLVKPKFFIPVHGEYKQLKKHKELAEQVGIPEENILIVNNGAKIELSQSEMKLSGKVPSGIIMIDGLGIGDVGNIVLRDRQHLAQDGIVIIVTTISAENGKILAGPDIITRGFVYARESEELIKQTAEKIKEELKKYEMENVTEWSVLKNSIKEISSKYLYEQTKRNPIILPIIMEI